MEDKKVEKKENSSPVAAAAPKGRSFSSDRNQGQRGGRPGSFRKPGRKRADKPAEEFEQKIVDLARVTRVMAGGKRMKFRACMIIGDKKNRVGVGIAKGADVASAIAKAVVKAKKAVISVPVVDGTIPHEVTIKLKASKIMLKPARKGSGIKAGGVLRIVLELAGVRDAAAKILGTNNKVNNAKAAIVALGSFLPHTTSNKQKPPISKEVDKQLADEKRNLTENKK